uniref:Homeobox domain-containing protein n=1 Tax=Anabas testudineus TaxID=64144 RepID=A0A3Q1HCE4_ANATE
MRARFSIEWMAQSSLDSGSQSCSTQPESLPGFYCRQRPEPEPEPEPEPGPGQERRGGHDVYRLMILSLFLPEVGFSSGTEEETSGYESEGGHSLSPPTPTADCTPTSSPPPFPPSPPSGRRPRTAFTAEQISSLEAAFKRNAYLGTQDKADLCKQLNLSDKQIRNWFQNRRMKLKRTVQDALAHACQANVASQFMHYPKLQAYRPSPYPRYHSAAAQEGPAAASYLHPHSLQYSSPLPSVSTLPLDSFYQYSLPGVMLPSTTTPLMGSCPTYPQYYSHCQ